MANAGLPVNRIQEVTNSRGKGELVLKGEHITIEDLKAREEMINKKMFTYLSKTIPNYPKPVEFHITEVTHVTNKMGLQKIWDSEGFKGSKESGDLLSWWSLKINEDKKEENIKEAEERYLRSVFSNITEKQTFLNKFTTSPFFLNHKSRYGNFRFTFPMTELMEVYKQQMCCGEEPVFRVFQTKLYKQEIVYAVLVHRPQLNEKFKDYPELTSSTLVSYESDKIIWKAQAICETHSHELKQSSNQFTASEIQSNRAQFYVWDQICIAFHLDEDKLLHFPKERLDQHLICCDNDPKINLSREPHRTLNEAELVRCKLVEH